MNELLLLLSLPELDHFFRDNETGKLKKHMMFIVDNGPGEQPSSTLVQMCLARLLVFLKLDKITQVSFSEYHSKRNFVERVHAEENKALGRHGPFRSNTIHSDADVGSEEHKENMEHVATEVIQCLKQASAKRPLLCYTGIRECDFVFKDEQTLHDFLDLSEERKMSFVKHYVVNTERPITEHLHFMWGVDLEFRGSYSADYRLCQNDLTDTRTSWKDKYTSTLYSPSPNISFKRSEQQPVPDYIRWLKTCELHCMPYHERAIIEEGPWDEIPGLFLPSQILDICFIAIPTPPPDIMKLIATLAWVRLHEASQY